tara:strand:+ start:206 stop:523 length:318 start_codon:yes stop_codon:yes gene_type:complete
MLEFINKLLILLSKKKLLTQIRIENRFFREFFKEDLEEDENELREELSKLRLIKQPTADTGLKMQALETRINKLAQVRSRLTQSETIEAELLCIIGVLQKSIWGR